MEQTYRLFAMPVGAKEIEAAEKERFARITPLYVLVYTDSAPPTDNSVEITEDDVERLSGSDRDWLLLCNMALIAEDAKRREKEISSTLGEKIERLERALEEASNKNEREEIDDGR